MCMFVKVFTFISLIYIIIFFLIINLQHETSYKSRISNGHGHDYFVWVRQAEACGKNVRKAEKFLN